MSHKIQQYIDKQPPLKKKPKQDKRMILINFAIANENKITTQQANDLLRGFYYTNHAHYVSEILTRMVITGVLNRVKKGSYELIRTSTTSHYPNKIPENQTQLNF